MTFKEYKHLEFFYILCASMMILTKSKSNEKITFGECITIMLKRDFPKLEKMLPKDIHPLTINADDDFWKYFKGALTKTKWKYKYTYCKIFNINFTKEIWKSLKSYF